MSELEDAIAEVEQVAAETRAEIDRLRAELAAMQELLHGYEREFDADVVAATTENNHLRELLYEAWGVISNADGWRDETEWWRAAIRWRDRWHATFPSAPDEVNEAET